MPAQHAWALKAISSINKTEHSDICLSSQHKGKRDWIRSPGVSLACSKYRGPWATWDPLKWEGQRERIWQKTSQALEPRHLPRELGCIQVLLEEQSSVLITTSPLCLNSEAGTLKAALVAGQSVPPQSFILRMISHTASEHTGHPLTAPESTCWASIHLISFSLT